MKSLYPVLAMVTSVLATPTSTMAAPTSSVTTSPRFQLQSRGLSPSNTTFDGLVLEPYHIYPAYNWAVLAPPMGESTGSLGGIIGYLNGTAAEIEDEESDLLFDYGNGNPPYGFVINQVNQTYNPIEINAGNGTRGIFIDQGVIKYHNPLSGGFYGELMPLRSLSL